jgi:hypothetical protein
MSDTPEELTPHEREAQGLADENAPDIGDLDDLDGDGVPDDLEDDGEVSLDDLVAAAPDEPEEGFDPAASDEELAAMEEENG